MGWAGGRENAILAHDERLKVSVEQSQAAGLAFERRSRSGGAAQRRSLSAAAGAEPKAAEIFFRFL